jgi:hypothetical protein
LLNTINVEIVKALSSVSINENTSADDVEQQNNDDGIVCTFCLNCKGKGHYALFSPCHCIFLPYIYGFDHLQTCHIIRQNQIGMYFASDRICLAVPTVSYFFSSFYLFSLN